MTRIAVVTIVIASAGILAQEQRPVFRAGTNLVAVDVYPTKDGAFLDGLTAQDFEVFEDGKPQKIEPFEIVHAPAQPADSELRDPNTAAEALSQAADPYARLFVLYLDTYTTTPEGAKRLRQPLLDFLRRTVSARDLFGVLLPDSNVKDLTFGRRLETLEHDLGQFWDWARAETPRETPPEVWLDRCYNGRTESPELNRWLVAQLLRLRRLELLFKGLDDLIPAVAAIREERTNLLLVSDGFLPTPPAQELTKYLWANDRGPQGPPPVGVRGGTLRVNPRLGEDPTKSDYTACDQELLRLTSLDFQRRFRTLVDAARRSNVAFFPVKSLLLGGTDFTKDMAIFDDSATGTLRNLAEMTGGAALVQNDLTAGFKEFSRRLSGYYLIGYASPNQKADGKYHRIDVKIKQPHVVVSARAGYVASKAPTEPPAGFVPVTPAAAPADADLQAAIALLDNHAVAPAGRVFGAPQLFRSTGRGPKTAATDPQFRRSEQLHVEWPRPDQPLEQLSARLLGRDGRPLAVPVTVVASEASGLRTISADCTLAPLAPGDYAIEVRASVSRVQERALVAFRLVR